MRPFQYHQASEAHNAVLAVASNPSAIFLAGGTTAIDLMKIEVLTPDLVIGINQLALADVEILDDEVRVGANVRNSQLAWHPFIRDRFPVLSEALLSGASTQLRNMATVAGNIMQRTRCPYFRNIHTACNKRQPGSGCDAIHGFNRCHAVLGTSEHCIATHPSDMCVAMVVLDAQVHTLKPNGTTRSIPLVEIHTLPGETPQIESVLAHGELITHVSLPHLPIARRSHYLKVRDRASYEFALTSAAVALDLDGNTVREARLAVGGIATKPWRCLDAERILVGRPANAETFREAAQVALKGAVGRRYNQFKIELAKRTIVRAFGTAKEMTV